MSAITGPVRKLHHFLKFLPRLGKLSLAGPGRACEQPFVFETVRFDCVWQTLVDSTAYKFYSATVTFSLVVRLKRLTLGHVKSWFHVKTRKPRKGAAVIAASMHGFASCRKFKSPVTLTLTLDRVKVMSTYTVRVGLPACSSTWL